MMELESWFLYHLVAITDCNQVMQAAAIGEGMRSGGGATSSRARDLGLRAQKKLLGHVISTGAGRSLFIDDMITSLLDNLYKLMDKVVKHNPNMDRKQPEKVLKNIVKLSIKIALLQRNQQLTPSDDLRINEIRQSLTTAAMTVVSFYELEFSFDKVYLTKSLERCRTAILELIRQHLTEKSQERCDQIFNFFIKSEFLDCIFKSDFKYRHILGLLVDDINKAIESGHL